MTDPIVQTVAGELRGRTVDGVHVFKGIHYGADTSGPHRFRPPRPVEPWTGVRDALEYGPNAPQLAHAEADGAAAEGADEPDTKK